MTKALCLFGMSPASLVPKTSARVASDVALPLLTPFERPLWEEEDLLLFCSKTEFEHPIKLFSQTNLIKANLIVVLLFLDKR